MDPAALNTGLNEGNAWADRINGRSNLEPRTTRIGDFLENHVGRLPTHGVPWGFQQTIVTIWLPLVRPPGIDLTKANEVNEGGTRCHSLALQADGTVVSWGRNWFEETNVPATATNVFGIAAGGEHSLAVRSDGSVIGWGKDWDGQIDVPPSATNVVAVAAGAFHNLVLQGDGKVIAWGDNSYGQCNVPATVTKATAIRAGYGHSLARLSDGTMVAWGKDYFGVTNVPVGLNEVADLSCGEDHDLALVGVGAAQASLKAAITATHAGASSLLSGNAAGRYPLTCQWHLNSAPLPGATNFWLVLDDLQSRNAGAYTLVASNSAGSASSAAVKYDLDPSPYFLTPLPVWQNVLVGLPFEVGIDGEGVQPLTFRAQLNGINLTDNAQISGATSPDLILTPRFPATAAR
jgi:hypothetical protein